MKPRASHRRTRFRRGCFEISLPVRGEGGLSIPEVLLTLALIALLSVLGFDGIRGARKRAGIAVSSMQLHQLVNANGAYAADHGGEYCPAMSPDNLTRWHGARRSLNERFDASRGYLSPYFGGGEAILTCPLLDDAVSGSFEDGAGGYGYNAEYIGGTPENRYRGVSIGRVTHPGRTIMFATTALATSRGVQEYPFTEPFYWVDRRGHPRGELQPSTHFRANRRAIIAWGDGHVSLEPISMIEGPNFYGGDNRKESIGWFGPREENGFWNPDSPAAQGTQRAETSHGNR